MGMFSMLLMVATASKVTAECVHLSTASKVDIYGKQAVVAAGLKRNDTAEYVTDSCVCRSHEDTRVSKTQVMA